MGEATIRPSLPVRAITTGDDNDLEMGKGGRPDMQCLWFRPDGHARHVALGRAYEHGDIIRLGLAMGDGTEEVSLLAE